MKAVGTSGESGRRTGLRGCLLGHPLLHPRQARRVHCPPTVVEHPLQLIEFASTHFADPVAKKHHELFSLVSAVKAPLDGGLSHVAEVQGAKAPQGNEERVNNG